MVGVFLDNTKLVAVGSVATVSGIILGTLWYKKYVKNAPPTNWVKVGEVSELCIYPVKSFKGIRPPSFECTTLGPKLGLFRDRSFIVVDDDGKSVTGRNYADMTRILPSIKGTVVSFSSPDIPYHVEFDMNGIQGEPKEVVIWGAIHRGIDCGDEVASWLSKCILKKEKGLRMLYCGLEEKGKGLNDKLKEFTKKADVHLEKNDGGIFSDGVSYHLISEASVSELNSRLEGQNVSPLNFRPNLVIRGEMLIPFEEDQWQWVKIGNVVFQTIAPCTRCLFTTVDANTGEKSEKMEPLATLRRYRHIRDSEMRKMLTSPVMGKYLGLRSEGSISVGDEVFISL